MNHIVCRIKNDLKSLIFTFCLIKFSSQELPKEGTAAGRNSVTIFSDRFRQYFKIFCSFEK